tara:strand:- start:5322 stop:5759 length:438 start_codon:yes stop_codon:yes gene_type:complete
MYLFTGYPLCIYMNILPDALIRYISDYVNVLDVLRLELALNRRGANKWLNLVKRYHREPRHKEVTIYKKGRNVKYVLDSYYEEDRLYTKVTSWYGKHKIISVVAHKKCTSTVEANLWTKRAFTLQKTSVEEINQLRRRIFLQLHV